jgi:hypothetical protein
MIEKKIEQYISSLKNPVYYYFVLFTVNKNITLKYSNIICKYFILYHWKEFLKYPIDIINNHFKIKNNIDIFYKNVIKINQLKKQLIGLNLRKFKNKKMSKIIKILNNMVLIFNSIYNTKIKFNYNKDIHNIAMLDNLKCIYKCFGYDFFKKFKIPLITYHMYDNLLYDEKVNYYNNVIAKLNTILRVLIKYIINYNHIKNKILDLVTKI